MGTSSSRFNQSRSSQTSPSPSESAPSSPRQSSSRRSWFNRHLLRVVQKLAGDVPVRLGDDGPVEKQAHVEPLRPAIVIRRKKTLAAIALNPDIGFGDAYSDGRIEVEGDLVRLLENLYQSPKSHSPGLVSRWLDWVQANTLRGSRRNIHHHYDLSNDFYRLWLDRLSRRERLALLPALRAAFRIRDDGLPGKGQAARHLVRAVLADHHARVLGH